jgi:hypothetical protein
LLAAHLFRLSKRNVKFHQLREFGGHGKPKHRGFESLSAEKKLRVRLRRERGITTHGVCPCHEQRAVGQTLCAQLRCLRRPRAIREQRRVGVSDTFVFGVSGDDSLLSSLSEVSFFDLDASGQYRFAARFRGFANGGSDKVTADFTPVPIPMPLAVAGAGLLAVGFIRRRRAAH